MHKKILVICFDTPYPTNYGGVYDIAAKFDFYKENNIKIDIICTCFDKQRVEKFKRFVSENETVIENYYIELIKPNFLHSLIFFSSTPFSAAIRKINYHKINFIKSNHYYLVLVEHLKSTYKIEMLMRILENPSETDLFLRIHNDEEDYYKNLYLVSKGLKRYFYGFESIKYKKYQEKILSGSLYDGFLFISSTERKKLARIIDKKENILLPVYTQLSASIDLPKTIDFLYIGNLDLDDNFNSLKKIDKFLQKNNLNEFKLKIVGKCSTEKRRKKVIESFHTIPKTEFQFNATPQEIKESYENSKFFLNFSSNRSGVKTKLMEAVSFGVPVISNEEGTEGSDFEHLVLNDKRVDINWLKKVLQDDILLSDYCIKYNESMKEKINQIENMYDNFFNSKLNQ